MDTTQSLLLLYATQTGMTLDVAGSLRDRLVEALPNYQIIMKDVRETAIEELAAYRQIIIGCSTWDHGIPAPDGEEFLSRLIAAKPDLSNSSFALFGLGDSAYPEFCSALPLIQADLERCQAVVSPEFFTIDGFADQAILANLLTWALNFINAQKSV